jgi:hypothetical protein
MGISAAAAILSGCAIVNNYQTPGEASKKGKKVTASISHFNILYLVPASNLDKLVDDLSEQCGDGKVVGINMTYTSRYFYIFGELSTFEVAGHCAE